MFFISYLFLEMTFDRKYFKVTLVNKREAGWKGKDYQNNISAIESHEMLIWTLLKVDNC